MAKQFNKEEIVNIIRSVIDDNNLEIDCIEENFVIRINPISILRINFYKDRLKKKFISTGYTDLIISHRSSNIYESARNNQFNIISIDILI